MSPVRKSVSCDEPPQNFVVNAYHQIAEIPTSPATRRHWSQRGNVLRVPGTSTSLSQTIVRPITFMWA